MAAVERSALAQQLAELPLKQRVVLGYYEGLGDPGIAGLVGCSVRVGLNDLGRPSNTPV